MNKKKIAALALSGTLLMGAAGFGAYSWFTDKATVSSNLTVSTGTLVLNATGDDVWSYTGPNKEITSNLKDGKIVNPSKFGNAQPGDSFAKEVTIENKGSLSEKVNFKVLDRALGEYAGVVNVTVKEANGNPIPTDSLTMAPGAKVVVKVGVELDGAKMTSKDWQSKSIDLSEVLGGNLVEANATQVNAPTVQPRK